MISDGSFEGEPTIIKLVDKNIRKKFKMFKITLCFISLMMFLPVYSSAFNFDVWQSGITLPEAQRIAIKQGLNLEKERNSHDLEHHVLVNSSHYKSKLFGYPVEITLTFTHSSNLLYKTDIRWMHLTTKNAEKLLGEVETTLHKKYGSFSKTSGKVLMVQNGRGAMVQRKVIQNRSREIVLALVSALVSTIYACPTSMIH